MQYFPAILELFPELTQKTPLALLAAAPTPATAGLLTRARIVTILRRCGRGNRTGLADKIGEALRAERLRQPDPVEDAMGIAAVGLVRVIESMLETTAQLERALHESLG